MSSCIWAYACTNLLSVFLKPMWSVGTKAAVLMFSHIAPSVVAQCKVHGAPDQIQSLLIGRNWFTSIFYKFVQDANASGNVFLGSGISVESHPPNAYGSTSGGLPQIPDFSFLFLRLALEQELSMNKFLKNLVLIMNHAFTKQASSSVLTRSSTGCRIVMNFRGHFLEEHKARSIENSKSWTIWFFSYLRIA